jgi:hypothetical protein
MEMKRTMSAMVAGQGGAQRLQGSTTIMELGTVEQVRSHRAEIVQHVSRSSFVVVRGLFNRDSVRAKLPSVYRFANTTQRLASAGVRPDEIQHNMAKWSIGGQSTTQSGLPRMMVTVYNPLFVEDLHGLHDDFQKIIEVRDALADRAVLTDEKLAPDRWNGCRVQIYPAGGGFMGGHADSRGVGNLPSDAGAFIQLLLLLTERGTDYEAGGAFVEREGKRIDSEADTLSGDIVVYDGATVHGVTDIDPTVGFNAADLRGRAVALATIYDKKP